MGRGRSAPAAPPRPRKRTRTAPPPPRAPTPEPDPDQSAPRVVGDRVAAGLHAGAPSGAPARATVVAVDPPPPAAPARLYVHFTGLDRRLDRWIAAGEALPPSAAPPLGADPAGLLPGVGPSGALPREASTAAAAEASEMRPVRTSKRATRGTRGTARVAAVAAAAAAADAAGGAGEAEAGSPGDGDAGMAASASACAAGDGEGNGADLGGGGGGGGGVSDSGGDAAAVDSAPTQKVTRSRRRALEEFNPVSERETGNDVVARMERAREEHTKVRNVAAVVFGAYEVDAWYFSPYPGSCARADVLYICPLCLKYMRAAARYDRHCAECLWNAPPGALIYSDAARKVTVYEVDGLVNVPYAQRLCLLGKLFLDHKTLYFDVAPFLFYVVCFDGELAGFFSKEKPLVASEFNLACIVTLPQHQRKGLGRFLIALSYELTRREGKTGSPERPLSDLGQLSYRSYWMHAVMMFVRTRRGAVGVGAKDVAAATGIRVADITATLKSMGILTIWKGETYVDSNQKALEHAQRRVSNPRLPLITSALKWSTMKKPDKEPPAASPAPSPRSPHPSAAGAPRNPRRKPVRRAPGGPRQRLAPPTPPPAPVPLPVTPTGSAVVLPANVVAGGEEESLKRFVRLRTAERVAAPLNSERGLQSAEVHALAEALNMTMEKCRKMLKDISASSIEDPADLTSAAVAQVPPPPPPPLPLPPPPPPPPQELSDILASATAAAEAAVVAIGARSAQLEKLAGAGGASPETPPEAADGGATPPPVEDGGAGGRDVVMGEDGAARGVEAGQA